MKLIIQSDDYGITRAVSLGCIHGIQNGVVRNTGMFANMPWIEECVTWIRPYLNEIAFGIDLNASTGPSILGHEQLPTLTKENGDFYTSEENRSFDSVENGFDHLYVCKDELYNEFKAQIERYIELVGHKPDYIHNHAYGTKTTNEVTRILAKEYGVICSANLMENKSIKAVGMGWYVHGGPEAQLQIDPIAYITKDNAEILKQEYGYLVSHCGYVDADLFRLSSFNTCRVKDLEALTSNCVKNWIEENGIELITFKDLPKEWIS